MHDDRGGIVFIVKGVEEESIIIISFPNLLRYLAKKLLRSVNEHFIEMLLASSRVQKFIEGFDPRQFLCQFCSISQVE